MKCESFSYKDIAPLGLMGILVIRCTLLVVFFSHIPFVKTSESELLASFYSTTTWLNKFLSLLFLC